MSTLTGVHSPSAGDTLRPDTHDFSVVLGGPLYQLVRRAHLSGGALELLQRRLVVITLVAWLPLLILSVMGGRAWGDTVRVPFLMDADVHARLLVALPLLIVAELVVHQRMLPLVRQFLERQLIAPASRARFDTALVSAGRLRNSVTAEILLIAFVYLVGVLYIKVELAVVPAALLLAVLGPLLLFMPHLAGARRDGLRAYGTLAQRYVREFDDKWLRGGSPAGEPLVGSGDIQSLADLANSFEVVRGMRLVPFGKNTVVQLAVVTLLPVAPLVLTMVSLDELLKRLLQVVL